MTDETAGGPTVLLVGCGRMGSAMLAGWLASGLVARAALVEPAGAASFGDDSRVTIVPDRTALPADFAADIVVLAVKPQVLETVAPAYRDIVARGAVVLSIAAGKTLATLTRIFGEGAALVRSMPNTPASISRGITVAVPNARVDAAARDFCTRLLAAVGAVEWVEDEALLDAVTALSGSGPAYIFLLIEAMAAAGAKAGLPPDLADRLARATVCGAAELARVSPESPATLRRNVTSPNGTTAAALDVLMAPGGMQALFDAAVDAATRRSRELAG
jgi:pyrroline-5-carboxylate reductase